MEQVTHAAPDVDQHKHHEQNLGEDRDEDVEYLLSRYILSGRGVVLALACILQTFIS